MKNRKRGFTLIELLVVVLIIGILAAVALPQYKLAVEKSRMVEGMTIVNSLQKAVDLYVLENGYVNVELLGNTPPDNGILGKLTIDIESVLDCTQDGGDECGSQYFTFDSYCYQNNNCAIRAQRRKNGSYDQEIEYVLSIQKITSEGGKWKKRCIPYDNYSYSSKLCKILEAQGWEYNEYQ